MGSGIWGPVCRVRCPRSAVRVVPRSLESWSPRVLRLGAVVGGFGVWGQVLGHGSGSGVGVHASQSTMRTGSRVVGALCLQLCAMRALCWSSNWLSWSGRPSGCPWVSRHVRAQPSPDRSGLGAIRTVAADAGSRGRRLAWQQRCRGRVGPLRASAGAQVKVAAAPPSAVGGASGIAAAAWQRQSRR